MLLCNCCGLRGCTQVVSAAQLMGGSLLCWKNFLFIESEPQAMLQLEEGSGGNNLPHEGFLLACPPCTSPTRSLPVFSRPLWVRRGTSSPPPNSLLSLSTNLPLWACVVRFSPLLITAALKATFLTPTTAVTLCRDGEHSQICKSVSPWEYSTPHHSLREAFHQPCHPMNQGFSGAPDSSVPGCWLFSWHAELLVEGSPALLTLPGFNNYQLFLEWKTKQELSPFSFLSLCGCMWCLGINLPAKHFVTPRLSGTHHLK